MSLLGAAVWTSNAPSVTGFSDAIAYGAAIGPATDDNTNNIGQGASARDDGMATLWSYTVPVEMLVACDRLTIQQSIGGLWDVAGPSIGYLNAFPRANYFVKVDGTTVHEGQLWARQRYDAQGKATDRNWTANFDQLASLGDGIALTAGQVVTLTIDPVQPLPTINNGFTPYVVRSTLVALNASSRHITAHGNYRPADLATGQTAFTFTVPAGGITLIGLSAWADGGTNVTVARCALYLNDAPAIDLGYLCDTCSRTRGEVFSIPLGFTLREGDTLSLRGNPWVDTGGKVSVHLIGTPQDVSSFNPGPTVTVVSPAEGTDIELEDAIVFDVTDDDGVVIVELMLTYRGSGSLDLYDSVYAAAFSTSTVDPITNGYRFTVRADAGWLTDVASIQVYAEDSEGNSSTTVLGSWFLTAADDGGEVPAPIPGSPSLGASVAQLDIVRHALDRICVQFRSDV